MDIDIDDERFIHEIEKRKSIWDSSTEEYKSKVYQLNEWTEICNIFYPDFEELDDKTKSRILNELRARWQTLFKSYLFHYLSTETMDGSKHEDEHVFSRQLAFLRPVMPPPAGGCSPEQEPTENGRKQGDDDTDGRTTQLENHNHNERAEMTRTSNHSSHLLQWRKRKAPERKAKNLKSGRRKTLLRPNFESEEEEYFDLLFTTIESLPSHLKRKFQTEASRLVYKLVECSRLTGQQSNSFTTDAQNPTLPPRQLFKSPLPPFQESQYPIFSSRQFNYHPLPTFLDTRHYSIPPEQRFYSPPVSPFQITQNLKFSSEFCDYPMSPFQNMQHPKLPSESKYNNPPVSPFQITQNPKLPSEFCHHPMSPFQNTQHPKLPSESKSNNPAVSTSHDTRHSKQPYCTSNFFPFLKHSQQSSHLNDHFENCLSSTQLPERPGQTNPTSPSKVVFAPKIKL